MHLWIGDLRIGTTDDVAGARAVWRAAGLGEPPEDLAASGGLLVVALGGDGGVVGLVRGAVAGDLVRLTAVAVQPDDRRRGVASALIEGLADAAYLRGARRLEVLADDGDDAARALYSAVGLEPGEGAGAGVTRYWAGLDPPVQDLEVREGLRLGQLLKLAAVAETGADAKALLAGGEVEVNGEVDQRRGRQMADGDVVIARGQAFRVVQRQE